MGGLRKLRRRQDLAVRKRLAALGPMSETLQAFGQQLFPDLDTLAMDATEALQHMKFLGALWNMVVTMQKQPDDLPAFVADMAAATDTPVEEMHAVLVDATAVYLDGFTHDDRTVRDVSVRVDENGELRVKVLSSFAV